MFRNFCVHCGHHYELLLYHELLNFSIVCVQNSSHSVCDHVYDYP